MAATDLSALGRRIREERLRRGVSLRSLARDVGVSASMISQIETAKSRPSVSTLYAITSALGMSIEDVFTPARLSDADLASASATVPAQTRAVVAATLAGPGRPAPDGLVGLVGAAARQLGPLVHPDDRQVLRLDSGVTWERLGELPGQTVDFLLVTYAPGATSSSGGELMRHAGAEYGYLLRGELVLTLGFDEVRLTAGDAISFESSTPHGYRNDGTEPAVGVWFVIEECLPRR
jgi:transcriptional regulator with XRE-family HTH domain/quercetin dioxygenase-like cupin family protein